MVTANKTEDLVWEKTEINDLIHLEEEIDLDLSEILENIKDRLKSRTYYSNKEVRHYEKFLEDLIQRFNYIRIRCKNSDIDKKIIKDIAQLKSILNRLLDYEKIIKRKSKKNKLTYTINELMSSEYNPNDEW